MFRSDAQEQRNYSKMNVDIINIDVICEIEKELYDSPYDVISLVFILYDIPDTALQRLIIYQRLSGDSVSTKLNLLHEWAQVAKSRPTWKYEFLEALLICQLYGIVKKLGFNVINLKEQYQPDNLHIAMHINVMKKALYKICENIDLANLTILRRTLLNMNIDTMELDKCELIFLKLMSEKFITVSETQYNKKVIRFDYKVDRLVKILEKLPGLENLAKELKMLENNNKESHASEFPAASSTPYLPQSDHTKTKPEEAPMNHMDFSDIYKMMEDLQIEDENILKSDTNRMMTRDIYTIKDPKRKGLCLVINQEDFCLSEKSINDDTLISVLPKRHGSAADKMELQNTMSSLNFNVVIGENLNFTDMIVFIKDTIRYNVKSSDSIFMLCIMSHGVRGHVYAADCVKVSIEDIQSILDSDEASMLRGIPKVLIIQACQVDDTPQLTLVADSPLNNRGNSYYLKKSDFLIYWATAPQFEAFRDEKMGSIFIQFLCKAIQKRGKKEHLYDIFTLVNNHVQLICKRVNCRQVPLFESTLRKKLYFQIPGQ